MSCLPPLARGRVVCEKEFTLPFAVRQAVWVKKNLHQGGAKPSGLFFYSQAAGVKQQSR
jgi:hypothetical protein